MRINDIRGTDHNSSDDGKTDSNGTGEMARDNADSCYSRRSNDSCLGSSNIGGSKRDHRGALCRAETSAPTDNSLTDHESDTALHNDTPMNEYTSQPMGINDENSWNNSGAGDTRNLCTKRQAVDAMVNNKENSTTLTRKQRQWMARKNRRENAVRRTNTVCRDTASSDSQTLP